MCGLLELIITVVASVPLGHPKQSNSLGGNWLGFSLKPTHHLFLCNCQRVSGGCVRRYLLPLLRCVKGSHTLSGSGGKKDAFYIILFTMRVLCKIAALQWYLWCWASFQTCINNSLKSAGLNRCVSLDSYHTQHAVSSFVQQMVGYETSICMQPFFLLAPGLLTTVSINLRL